MGNTSAAVAHVILRQGMVATCIAYIRQASDAVVGEGGGYGRVIVIIPYGTHRLAVAIGPGFPGVPVRVGDSRFQQMVCG